MIYRSTYNYSFEKVDIFLSLTPVNVPSLKAEKEKAGMLEDTSYFRCTAYRV